MRFEFATAARIVFGPGTLAGLGVHARELGRHALIVTGRDSSRADRMLGLLRTAGIESTRWSIAREPALDDITGGTAQARAAGCDFVIGCGGGAALDSAKAISALLGNGGDLLDYLEVIGRAQPLTRPGAPCIAIPTTAGTGSEVTRNAVLTSPAHRLKASLRGPQLLPRLALVDPELTLGLPAAITASTGLDALTQLIEPYVSNRATPLTDAFCVEGIRRAARSLRRACDHGTDLAAREDMALASLLGGLALAHAGLGAVHGLAAPIGGMFSAPHGSVCAALLPHVMTANLRALHARAPGHDAIRRYGEVARLLTGDGQASADAGTRWVTSLVIALGIRPLSDHGVTHADFPAIVDASTRASSMKANPLVLTRVELETILESAL
jgi:alcohol dehydrogenase class IV